MFHQFLLFRLGPCARQGKFPLNSKTSRSGFQALYRADINNDLKFESNEQRMNLRETIPTVLHQEHILKTSFEINLFSHHFAPIFIPFLNRAIYTGYP